MNLCTTINDTKQFLQWILENFHYHIYKFQSQLLQKPFVYIYQQTKANYLQCCT